MPQPRVFLFDLGGVLIDWNPNGLYEAAAPDPVQRSAFLQHMPELEAEANKSTWVKALPVFAQKYPELADVSNGYLRVYYEHMPRRWPIAGTVEILKQIKDAGYKAYVASNWAADSFEDIEQNMPFLSLFDGAQISGYVGLIKPHADFFERMMRVFDFKADEAIFIDDLPSNIEGAQKLGIEGILFKTPEQLRQDLKLRHIRSFDCA